MEKNCDALFLQCYIKRNEKINTLGFVFSFWKYPQLGFTVRKSVSNKGGSLLLSLLLYRGVLYLFLLFSLVFVVYNTHTLSTSLLKKHTYTHTYIVLYENEHIFWTHIPHHKWILNHLLGEAERLKSCR